MASEAQVSFPKVNAPLTAEEWASVTLGIGNGTLDEGTGNYRITFDDALDQCVVSPPAGSGYAHAIVAGFYHHLYQPVRLPLPPVTQKTTYIVALTFDPTKAETTPVALTVHKNNLDSTGGKKHVVLVEVDRQPSQVLSQATKRGYAQRIAPMIDMQDSATLPSASQQIFGSMAYVNRDRALYRVSLNGANQGAAWSHVLGTKTVKPLPMGGWDISTQSPNQYGINVTPTPEGFKAECSFNYIRSAFSYNVGGSWSVLGTFIPPELRTVQYAESMFPVVYLVGGSIRQLVARVSFFDGTLSLINPFGGTVEMTQGGQLNVPAVMWTANKLYTTDA